MLTGIWAIGGWYTISAAGCATLPLVEVNSTVANMPFGGWMAIESDGTVTGKLVDSLGVAEVTGQMTETGLVFQKVYLAGLRAEQPPIHYQLNYCCNPHTITYTGVYKFLADRPTVDGDVQMNFLPRSLVCKRK